MKLPCLLISLICLITQGALGQSFTNKTNAVNLDLGKPLTPTSLPEIVWTTPRVESSVSAVESIVVEANVKSEIEMRSIKLIVIHPEETREKNIAVQPDERNKVIKQPLHFLSGENIIRITVENVKGGSVSSSRTILVGKDEIADAVDANRKDYALIFATDAYENWDDLVNPVSDAQTISAILSEKYGFVVETVTNASLEEITSKLYDYNTRQFNPQDQLFVFFAGHGYYDEVLGEGYVVATNSIKNDKGKNTYLSHNTLRQRLDNMKCEHIFLAMDVCFGGTFDPVLARARAGEVMDEATDRQYLVRKLSKRTRKYLTSGSKEYVSDGIPGKNSPFAAKFIQALREIGGGSGRILTLPELSNYFQRLQTEPRLGSFGNDDSASDFVFVAK
jgi:hypothetical protein